MLDYIAKKDLAKKISRITNRRMLLDIYNIIKDNNDDLVVAETDTGIYIKFNTLTDETYFELYSYLEFGSFKIQRYTTT
jgi:hypothetical protein